jgi:hypothetical protein
MSKCAVFMAVGNGGTVVEDHIRLYKASGQVEKSSYEKTNE